jgi:hypothetical protein
MSSTWRTILTPKRAALAIAAITVLTGAGPVAEAGADPTALPAPAVQALADAGALTGLDLSQIPIPGYALAYAHGGAGIRDVFNGGTTVCVASGSSVCSTNAAP